MLCKCGCQKEAISKTGFYKGHWNKGRKRPDVVKRNLENNPWKGILSNKKLWENRNENAFVIWNKGLTFENDERVKKYRNKRNQNLDDIGKKISETKKKKYKDGSLIPYWKGKNRKNDEKFIEKMRISTIKRILRQGKCVSYNENSISFFDYINEKYNLEGFYGKNEFKCLGYSLDYYSPKYNIVIEWDEEFHYKNDRLLSKDIKRQEIITNYLFCKFIRIREVNLKKFDLNIIEKTINEIK